MDGAQGGRQAPRGKAGCEHAGHGLRRSQALLRYKPAGVLFKRSARTRTAQRGLFRPAPVDGTGSAGTGSRAPLKQWFPMKPGRAMARPGGLGMTVRRSGSVSPASMPACTPAPDAWSASCCNAEPAVKAGRKKGRRAVERGGVTAPAPLQATGSGCVVVVPISSSSVAAAKMKSSAASWPAWLPSRAISKRLPSASPVRSLR